MNLEECKRIIGDFIRNNPDIWDEEIERVHD